MDRLGIASVGVSCHCTNCSPPDAGYRELASFGANAYMVVKADLKDKHPKQYWPNDFLEAEPAARANLEGR